MNVDYNNRTAVNIVSALFYLVENKGFTPDEVVSFLDNIKENVYEELQEVYRKK